MTEDNWFEGDTPSCPRYWVFWNIRNSFTYKGYTLIGAKLKDNGSGSLYMKQSLAGILRSSGTNVTLYLQGSALTISQLCNKMLAAFVVDLDM